MSALFLILLPVFVAIFVAMLKQQSTIRNLNFRIDVLKEVLEAIDEHTNEIDRMRVEDRNMIHAVERQLEKLERASVHDAENIIELQYRVDALTSENTT